MLKRIVLCLLMYLVCTCVSFASLSEADDASDGLLETGEYDGSAFDLENTETLIVRGGGAYSIDGKDNSYIKVEYTSVNTIPGAGPVTNGKGIWDIFLYDNSELLWLDGAIDEITVGNYATADLKGGYIDALTIYNGPNDSCEVTIYCQAGYVVNSTGISGLWEDGTSFDIGFNDVGYGMPQTYESINVKIVPEPATMALFGLGGLLLCRKK